MDTPIEAVFTFRRDEYVRAMRRHYKTNLQAGRDIVAGAIAIISGLYLFQSFSDDGIGFKTDEIDSVLKWSIYHSWLRDDEFYIMYHGKRDLSVVPRRVLASEDTDERFAHLLRRNIGPPLS